MARKPTKSRQTRPKKPQFYTPAPVRERVVARHVNGQSNRLIASEEAIDRETVARILTQPEVVQMIVQYRSRLLLMVPKAITAYENALDSDDERVRAATATKVLEGLQVFPKGSIDPPSLEPDPRQQKLLMLGQMMEMILYKGERYGISLPTELEAVQREL